MYKIVICGARRSRQGIGEYITKYFHLLGMNIAAIVAKSEATKNLSVQLLKDKYKIECNGYLFLEEAIEKENPDIVVICTPPETHYDLLKIVVKYKKHCLCEKPLVWMKTTSEISSIIDDFMKHNLFLDTVTQWPYTLPYFYKIYPEVMGQKIKTFSMLMGPISLGKEMIVDSIPHILSMLYKLVGVGKVSGISSSFTDQRLLLHFSYDHHYSTRVECIFEHTEIQPRPAKYRINNSEVHREICLENYQIFFTNNQLKIAIPDPLQLLIKNYIENVNSNTITNKEKLIHNIEQGIVLYEKVRVC